jgi:hypothetical protein
MTDDAAAKTITVPAPAAYPAVYVAVSATEGGWLAERGAVGATGPAGPPGPPGPVGPPGKNATGTLGRIVGKENE